jgi:hypothetical protein
MIRQKNPCRQEKVIALARKPDGFSEPLKITIAERSALHKPVAGNKEESVGNSKAS